jgi:cysteine desulfurase
MLYLDYAATAPIRPEVVDAVIALSQETCGNPSSLHRAGRRARHHLESARESIASLLGARVEEIVFCSGATEADNLALLGSLYHSDSLLKGLVTSTLEHAAVYEPARKIQQRGIPVDWLEVNGAGQVVLESLESVLRRRPGQLVSVMATNNEVGSQQPLAEVASLCRQHGATLHVDAVQAPRAAPGLISEGLADLLTLSGHKMGGLPGGMLYVRQGLPLAPQILGGAQEDGRRAGTSDVARAVSLALALKQTLGESPEPIRQARDLLETRLAGLPGAHRLGPQSSDQRADHISSWLFADLGAEPILARLDLAGVCASSGSACSSHAVEPSRVLQAMGYPDQAMGLVRFSLGWQTCLEDVRRAAAIVEEVLQRMLTVMVKR